MLENLLNKNRTFSNGMLTYKILLIQQSSELLIDIFDEKSYSKIY